MKPYSNMRYLIEYLLIAFSAYFILTGIIAAIGNVNYRELLCSSGQMYAISMIYWWIPIPRMCDMDNHNENIRIQQNKPFFR